MKKILISLVIIICFLFIVSEKGDKKYITQDGVVFALTLDGKSITEFPNGTNYKVEMSCKNGKGIWLTEDWNFAIEDITGNVTCDINFISNPLTLKSIVETVNASQNYNDHGYRYSGKTPNNYVWFNNEIWRIIGSIPTCTSSGCATSENLVKIIRNETIGTLSYDAKSSEYTGVWGSNTLYDLLNTHYYATSEDNLNGNSHVGCGVTQGDCDYRAIGILSNSYYGKMIKNVYWNTGISSCWTPVSTVYEAEITAQTVSGYIGLMSASDFGYAVSSSYHGENVSSYNTKKITSTNWLYNYEEWTNIQSTNDTTQSLNVGSTGSIVGIMSNYRYNVRPALYLNSSVYVVSGDGSITSPYTIAM